MTPEQDKTFEIDAEGYRKLARVEEVAPGEMIQVILDAEDWEVAIANANGEIYAFRDVCPHQAFPLSVGRLKGCKLICYGHNWEFDVRTGKALFPPIPKKLELYPVRIENGDIWVKVHIW